MSTEQSILLWGEFFPATSHGISINNSRIYEWLLKSGKMVDKLEEKIWDKGSLVKILCYFYFFFKLLHAIQKSKVQKLYFNLPLSTLGLLRLWLMLPIVSKLNTKARLLAHLHRGDILEFIHSRMLNRFLLRRVSARCHKVLVLSHDIKKSAGNYIALSKIEVVHNSSSFEEAYFRQQKKSYERKFVCVSNYLENKNIHGLIESLGALAASEIKLDIYGQAYDKNYFNKINRKKTNSIQLKDSLSRTEFVDRINKYDCLVLPSLNEGQPLVLLEAMSLGIPVICSDAGDIPSMVGMEYPFLFSCTDPNGLKNAIKNFDEYPEKEMIGTYLRKRYMDKFSIMAHKKKILSIFA